MKALLEEGHDAFMALDLAHFRKAFPKTDTKCDVVHNNMSECFNGYICQVRTTHYNHAEKIGAF